jgi:prepilin-type N-terminal cleavage/methylation domain-containing protein
LDRAGFSLIEALIALAIASVALLVILNLQGEMAIAQRHLDRSLYQSNLQRSAIAMLQDVNPEAVPSGEIDISSDAKLTWTSQPISNERLSTGFPTGNGAWLVRLYRLSVHIVDNDAHPVADFQFDRVGWRRDGGVSAQATAP